MNKMTSCVRSSYPLCRIDNDIVDYGVVSQNILAEFMQISLLH